ncbi:kinase-like protein [Peniophora sp. CONT]|nr:kinase-like protein [Peniophora sp. CONT]
MVDDVSRIGNLPCALGLEELKSLINSGEYLTELNVCGSVAEISDNRVIKYGSKVTRSEAMATELIRKETTIRVPRVLSYTTNSSLDSYARRGYLVMEKLPGETLLEALLDITPAQKAIVIEDLREVVSQLRRLDDPRRWGMFGKSGAFHGGHFNFTRQDDRKAICRPQSPHAMADVRDFALASLRPSWRELYENSGRLAEMIRPAFVERESRFLHPDLRPENILVDETTRHITGIIDWACAGWYPPFWYHYVALKAQRSYSDGVDVNWRDIYQQVFPLYEKEVDGFSVLLEAAQAEGEDYCGREMCDCCE